MKKIKKINPWIVALSVPACVAMCMALLFWLVFWGVEESGKERTKRWNYHSPKFLSGDVVIVKAFGHKGVVLNFSCHKDYAACRYGIRVSSITSSTPNRIIGSGGAVDVAPMSIIDGVREFEIELYHEKVGS